LQDVDLQTRVYLWFMHYGAPPLFLLTVQEHFEQVVYRTRGWKKWIKYMACSFTWCKLLTYLPL